MNEDDTFKKLQGLTQAEASEMYDYLYQLGMDSPTTKTIQDVRDYVDERLRPYGWTSAKIEGKE